MAEQALRSIPDDKLKIIHDSGNIWLVYVVTQRVWHCTIDCH